jgi:hypothetical protein
MMQDRIAELSHQKLAPKPWWFALVSISILSLTPLLTTQFPPLLDYLNHLARMFVIGTGWQDPMVSRMYRAEWHIVPNVGMDVLVPLLMKAMPLEAAGRLFVAFAVLLPFLGVTFLHRTIFREQSYWPFLSIFVIYNRLFFTGFVNFLVGIGLALIAAALWLVLGRRRSYSQVAVAAIAAVIIFFCHLVALVFFALLLFCLEIFEIRRREVSIYQMLPRVLIPFALPALLYINAPISAELNPGTSSIVELIRHYYWSLAATSIELKLYGLISPFLTYDRVLDALTIALCGGAIVLLIRTQNIIVSPSIMLAISVLMALYPVTPFVFMNSAWIDQRLPIMAGYLIFAGAKPRFSRFWIRRLLPAAAVILAVLRIAEISDVWWKHNSDVADFLQVIGPVQPGDRVLVVQPDRPPGANNPDSLYEMRVVDPTQHLPGLLLIYHKAFWPLLFAVPTKHLVGAVGPYRALSVPEGLPPQVRELSNTTAISLEVAPYLDHWPDKFDWALLLRPGEVPDSEHLIADHLKMVATGKTAALYRIVK